MSETRLRASTGSPFEPKIGFSRGVREGRIIAISGAAPLAPNGATVGAGDPAAQARRCFEIVDEALHTLGADITHVIRTRVLLTRIEDWEAVAAVHGKFFRNVRPASTVLQVSRFIDPAWLIEVKPMPLCRRMRSNNGMQPTALRAALMPGVVRQAQLAEVNKWPRN